MAAYRKEDMKTINNVFDRLDQWRHLPSYQLERRADLYFALYLPEVLSRHFKMPIKADVIPEFPVRKGTINNGADGDKSYKVDYLALSEDGQTAFLVELKTEMESLNEKQRKYLKAAKAVPFYMLLEGINLIFQATAFKRKYYCLLEHLENLGLLTIPQKMKTIIALPSLRGITDEARNIKMGREVAKIEIVFIQPEIDNDKKNPGTTIDFKEFRSIVDKHPDPISQRFASSLKEWKQKAAGSSKV